MSDELGFFLVDLGIIYPVIFAGSWAVLHWIQTRNW